MAPTPEQRLSARLRPAGPPVMRQRWEHLAFLHWRWDVDALQARLPAGLQLDLWEGEAWLGVVPFFMSRIRPRGLPAVPWLSWFLELNVRTYVADADGRPGVWFFSLDCNRLPAVWLARTFFHLPYHWAHMHAHRRAERWDYRSRRRGDPHVSTLAWEPTAAPAPAVADSLEFFLAERYRLFSSDRRGQLHSGRVFHAPYRLAPAVASASVDPILTLGGFARPGRPADHVLACDGVDVDVFALDAHSA